MFQGDLGNSMIDDRPITEAMERGLPLSAELAIGAIIFSTILAIPLGVISAVRQNTLVDYIGRVVAITGITIPLFIFAVLVLFILVKAFGYSPLALEYQQLWEDPWDQTLSSCSSQSSRSHLLELGIWLGLHVLECWKSSGKTT